MPVCRQGLCEEEMTREMGKDCAVTELEDSKTSSKPDSLAWYQELGE